MVCERVWLARKACGYEGWPHGNFIKNSMRKSIATTNSLSTKTPLSCLVESLSYEETSVRLHVSESKSNNPEEKWLRMVAKYPDLQEISTLQEFQRLTVDEVEELFSALGVSVLHKGPLRNLHSIKTLPPEVVFIGGHVYRIAQKELSVGGLLGEGAFSKVFQATWLRSSLSRETSTLHVAVKIPKHSSDFFASDLIRDLGVMMDFPHQNILTLYGVCVDTSPPQLVIERMDMDLSTAIKKGLLDTQQVLLRTLCNIAEGLAYLHSKNVIHRDLKPSNVLLRLPDHVKLCDFGASRDITKSIVLSVKGTEAYLSPETRAGQPSGKKSDIWAFGVLMFECMTGEFARPLMTTEELIEKMTFAGCMPELISLVKQCRESIPANRLAASTLASDLARLLVQNTYDSHNVIAELKVCLKQDLETYEQVWSSYKSKMASLLVFVANFATKYPAVEARQKLIAPASFDSLHSLSVCASFLHDTFQRIVETCGGTYTRGPRKSEHRAKQKAAGYKGDYTRLLDFERGTGIFAEPHELEKCMVELDRWSEIGNITIARSKDRLNSPLESGYRDVLLNLRDSNSGFIAELLLVFTKIAEVQSHTHRFYELARQMKLSR